MVAAQEVQQRIPADRLAAGAERGEIEGGEAAGRGRAGRPRGAGHEQHPVNPGKHPPLRPLHVRIKGWALQHGGRKMSITIGKHRSHLNRVWLTPCIPTECSQAAADVSMTEASDEVKRDATSQFGHVP